MIPHKGTTFLSGLAGAGKTTLAMQHMRALLEAGAPGEAILVMAPQRSLLRPYQDELRRADLPPGSMAETLTLGGLARRMVDLFWPAVAPACGFVRPRNPPVFLTLETAQYYMQRIVAPLASEAGYFEGVHIQPHRLYSQILDNLNKAAIVGFSHLEIGQRLKDAWSGPSARAVIFNQVQDCAARFRQFCLQNNLLDFSLQVEAFTHHLQSADWFCNYLFGRYRRLIIENVEEEPPVTHDLIRDWLPQCDSALIVYDADAGLRRFLGADPDGGLALRLVCQNHIELTASRVTSPDLQALAMEMGRALERQIPSRAPTHYWKSAIEKGNIRRALGYGGGRFHPDMLDWVAGEASRLINDEGIRPGQIVILAPYLSDALRFALSDRLARAGVPAWSLRPSRALNEEPAARCLLTLAALAYPAWNITPLQPDVAHALTLAVDGLDPARAHLLAQRAYTQISDSKLAPLRPFDALATELQDRIGYGVGEQYEKLRAWLNDCLEGTALPLDHFLGRLFGEVLAQPGFAFHRDLDSGRVAAGLIASARKFRQVVAPSPPAGDGMEQGAASIGRAYFDMVQSGVIAAEYGPRPPAGESGAEPDAVLLAPAYTFLLNNQPVDVQFWINAGSSGWWERLYQPLTHPYVLTRHWPAGQLWTDEDEQAARALTLNRLIQGLIRRCRRKMYLAFSTLGEQGFEERGPLLMIAQQILRHLPANGEFLITNNQLIR